MSYLLPKSATPFTLSVSEQDLLEWRQLLQLSKLGPITYENQQTERNFGVTYKWLSETKEYWLNNYDWRAQEKYINSFDNFKMQIEDIDLHFIGHFSERKDAVPIIFMHGWPGSMVEFLPMLELIKKQYEKKDLPYHIVIPSLPGFPLSSGGPIDKDWTMQDTAHILNQLMNQLGFDRYLAQGGDIGSLEAQYLSLDHDACVGMHVNLFSSTDRSDQPEESSLSALEKLGYERSETFNQGGSAYGQVHGTRPSTIGHVVSSNPLALLAWIGEKLIEWSDETPGLDHILTNVSLYWFTGSYPRSIFFYRVLFGSSPPRFPYFSKPTGFSFFPYELLPGIKSVLEKQCNLVYYKQHERGGHFAALEWPQELWQDVEEFVAQAWKP